MKSNMKLLTFAGSLLALCIWSATTVCAETESGVKNKSITIKSPQAADPFLGIDKELLAEEEALLAKVKGGTTQPKVVASTKKVSVTVSKSTPRTRVAKLNSTPPAKQAVVKSTSTVTTWRADTDPSNTTKAQASTSKTAVIDTTLQAKRLAELEIALAAQKGKVSSSERRVRELSVELSRTKDKLMIAETEVDRLSKMLNLRREEKLLRYLPEGSRVASRNSDTPSRMNVAPSGAIISAGRSESYSTSATTSLSSSNQADMPVVTVVADKAFLRTGPGQENSPLMSIKHGTKLAVEVREGQWYRVTSPTGDRAWISADVVTFANRNTSLVKSTLRVRGYDSTLDNNSGTVEDKAFDLINRR